MAVAGSLPANRRALALVRTRFSAGRCRDGAGEVDGVLEQVIRRHDRRHEVDRERLVGVDVPSRQAELAGQRAADEIVERAVDDVGEGVLRDGRTAPLAKPPAGRTTRRGRSHRRARARSPRPRSAGETGAPRWWYRSLDAHSSSAYAASSKARSNSDRSKPAENTLPAPVITTTFSCSSGSSSSRASLMASRRAIDRAFLRSDRSRVSTAMAGSGRSRRRRSAIPGG